MKIKVDYTNYINSLILLFFIAVVFKRTAMDLVFLSVSFTGIYFAIKEKKLPFQIKEVQLLTLLFWGYFIAVIFSIIAHPKSTEVAGFLSREVYFLLAPFASMAIIKAKINLNWLVLGSKLGLFLIGIIVIYESFLGASRPSGFLNAITFANLAVLLFFIVLVASLNDIKKQQIIPIIASLSVGGLSIMYIGGRSAWIAFVFLLLVVVYLQFKQRFSIKLKTILLGLLIIGLLGSFNSVINQRAGLAYNNVAEWFNGDLTMSSAGQRLEMMRIGAIEAPNVPFFGNGYRNINQSIITDKYNHKVHDKIRLYTHLHNAYLTNFIGGGYPLFFALLLNLFVPFLVFKKALMRNKNQLYASIGIIITVGYMIFGLINHLFGDVFMNAFYTFSMAILLPKLQTDKDEMYT
ncbi:O-antigen ligase family protein [Candidatus Thioglobus sp.]|nr:O-antigen ligase family protein [Candidatus Thioglobus sp.]